MFHVKQLQNQQKNCIKMFHVEQLQNQQKELHKNVPRGTIAKSAKRIA